MSDVREQSSQPGVTGTQGVEGGEDAPQEDGQQEDGQEQEGPGEQPAQEPRLRNAEPRAAGPGAGAEEAVAEGGDENTLEGEAEIAADYLEELLDIADLDGDIDTYIEGGRAHVSVVSQSTVLVGDQGEVLDALQELTRLAVMTETGDRSRLMLDIAGFRERRRDQLLSSANAAVEQARSSNQAVPLNPMNPFERKIVHDAVAAAGLSSASEGDEPLRHVVVHPSA